MFLLRVMPATVAAVVAALFTWRVFADPFVGFTHALGSFIALIALFTAWAAALGMSGMIALHGLTSKMRVAWWIATLVALVAATAVVLFIEVFEGLQY